MFKNTPEVDAKILRKYSNYINSSDPLVGNISCARTLHSGGAIYRSEDKKLETPMRLLSSTVSRTVEDVNNFNLEKVCTDIYDLAQELLADIKKMMFKTLTQVTDFTGNVVNGKGKGLSHEMLIELLEKIHIDFDQEGNPMLPTMVMSPDMAKNFAKLKSQESLYKTRYEEIINQKRKAYYAEKGCRRLSRID